MKNTFANKNDEINGVLPGFSERSGVGTSAGEFENLPYSVGEHLGSLTNQVSDKSSLYLEQSRQYVRENPVKGVVIAAATGGALGLIVGSLLKRNH